MTFKQVIKQIITGAVTVGTALGSAAVLGEFLGTGEDFFPSLIGVIFLGGTSFFGGKYFLKQRDDVKRLAREKIEKEILRLTVLNDGRLNVTEAVLEMDISVEKSKEALENLVAQNVLQTGISEEGGVSYYLVDYLGQDKIENNNRNFID
jgi:hypothetical protein